MIRQILRINAVLLVCLAAGGVIYPAVRALVDLRDPALQRGGIPESAWRLYRNLTPRYAAWARARIAAGRGEHLPVTDISGTEWPLFGSVFYLWAIENLQTAWEGGDHRAGSEPKVFAKPAIMAAAELVTDPKNAAWVKKHWGQEYLHRENVFYRMLVITALSTREKLLQDGFQLALLRDQVETLAEELDRSRTGLLDDYPGQCYPGDVMTAWMTIKRADAILGTDHSPQINRSLRAFTNTRLTQHGLPPFAANANTGLPISPARGCANAYFCLVAPELWPATAKEWFNSYDRFFWQEHLTAAGFREFANDTPVNWEFDVDAGPVLAGYGAAACAFGLGAARKNGRFDRAYPLSTEMLVVLGELPNGVLAMPRLLSNLSEAPMLGEAAILWQLTIQPEAGFPIKAGGRIPAFVYLVLLGMLLLAGWLCWTAFRLFQMARGNQPNISKPKLQATIWCMSLLAALLAVAIDSEVPATILLVLAVMLPVTKRARVRMGRA